MHKSFRVPMNGIASKHGFPEDDIIWRYLVEYSLCILYAHTFSVHVHDTTTNPFIRLQTNSNDLFMSASAFLSAATVAHAFRIPTKVTGFGSTPSCCISSYSSNPFCPYPHFTYATITALQPTTSQVGILLKTLEASSMLPHLAYMSTRLVATNISDSYPRCMIGEWICLPSEVQLH